MSDHLPVVIKAYVDVNVSTNVSVDTKAWEGYHSNGVFKFKSNKIETKLQVVVYDLHGKTIQMRTYANQKEFELKLIPLKKGLFFVKITSDTTQDSYKIFID
jgi:hypothetical protein